MGRGFCFTAAVYPASPWLLHTNYHEFLSILARISRFLAPMDIPAWESICAHGAEQSLTHAKQTRSSSTYRNG